MQPRRPKSRATTKQHTPPRPSGRTLRSHSQNHTTRFLAHAAYPHSPLHAFRHWPSVGSESRGAIHPHNSGKPKNGAPSPRAAPTNRARPTRRSNPPAPKTSQTRPAETRNARSAAPQHAQSRRSPPSAHPRSPALAALTRHATTTRRLQIRVLRRELMPAKAMRLRLKPATRVLRGRHHFHVARVHATLHPTQVIDRHTLRDRTNVNLKRDPMRELRRRTETDRPVTLRVDRTRPDAALVRLDRLREEVTAVHAASLRARIRPSITARSKRRCPPGVRNDWILFSRSQLRRVETETPSIRAATPIGRDTRFG